MAQFISSILLAGGCGSRFGGTIPKQFISLGKKLVVHHSLELLLSCEQIQEVVIVVTNGFQEYFSAYTSPKIRFAPSGATRQESVYQGFLRVCPDAEYVCIHDGARPLVTRKELLLVIEDGIQYQAAALGVPAKNTMKKTNALGFVEETLSRECLYEMHTPQVLSTKMLWKGLSLAEQTGVVVTDDISLAELAGCRAKVTLSSYRNIKITTPEDLIIAKALMENTHAEI
ncbi:MAG: 2-C-methyl-D-erythritol 4-phosphate cytidylyltransferase [Chlamydiae bacterium]|nr:2-C-methyl-D-erythritol 4-phosphate cytidylyltransferase [Chlamydiota bacterium]